ncbi:hypothetical protein DFH28DRAFT_888206 [Melampsora americana]|nr:hypothetical protein DFH28DRAFT_888206 [Melampsora americana]
MDEDEAFLYGDDEINTEPKRTQSSSEAPPSVFKSTFEAVPRISATPEISEKPLAVEASSIPPLPTPIADIEQDIPNPFLSAAKPTQDIASDLESNDDPEGHQEAGEDDDEELEEEDSDDDLHIILEGDGTHLHSAPNARVSVSTTRPEVPRESPAQPRAIDPTNATTEYKILERTEGKPPETSTPGPTKPTPSSSHNQYRNPYELPTHNRLPTPENFPRPATPPQDPSLGDQQPPINSEAPVPLTGYDDKDGTTLMNFDFDAIPDSEKGWKKPGAHVADWFNYGFDETTWRWYVMKQKRHRADESWAANPFAAFATGNIQEAWDTLPSELKGVMMQTIMGPNAGTNGNHGPQMPPPPMPQMMVMNPMMQGMDMGGFGLQGMQGMPGIMGNGHMNGTHHNAGMNNQHNEGPSRGQPIISLVLGACLCISVCPHFEILSILDWLSHINLLTFVMGRQHTFHSHPG